MLRHHPAPPPGSRAVERGFTLIELAIVMAIIGIMLAGSLKLLGGQSDRARANETEDRLQIAYDALVAFYASNTYLPCPADGGLADTDPNFGRAQPETSGPCTAITATRQVLPWRTLGLQEELSFDAWNRRLRYAVTPALTTAGATSLGNLSIRDGSAGVAGTAEITPAAAFVVISHGANGFGARLLGGTAQGGGPTPAHEQSNSDGTSPFVDKAISDAAGEEFDDLVIWREKPALAREAGAVFGTGAICTAADAVWTTYTCASSTSDECTVAGAVRSRCG